MLTKNVNFLMKNVMLLLPNHYKCYVRKNHLKINVVKEYINSFMISNTNLMINLFIY